MRKFLFAFLILALLAPIVVMAQSQTNTTSYGLFKLDKDSYLSPLYWPEIERPVLFMQFGLPASGGATAFDLGLGLPLSGMYAGANINFYDYVTGQLGGSLSTQITTDAAFTYDLLGNKTSDTRTTEYDYLVRANKSNSLVGLFGMQLGDMNLAVYDYFNVYDNAFSGYYGAVYATPATAAWTALATPVYQDTGVMVGTLKSTVVVKDGSDQVISSSTADFATGRTGSATLSNNLRFGLSMPVGGMKLLAETGFNLYDVNQTSFGSYNIAEVRPLLSYAAFTPGASVSLNGVAPAAIDDLQEYSFSDQSIGSDYTDITPLLNLGIEMPFDFGYPGTLTAGLNSSWRFRARGNDYIDLAGASQNFKGSANYAHTYVYQLGTPDVLGRFTSTTTETRANELFTYTADLLQSYEPTGKLEVKPSDRFNFSVSLKPLVSIEGYQYAQTGNAVSVETYFDDDGVITGDADDYVQTTTLVRESTSYAYNNFKLTANIVTGAQFYLIPERLRVNLGGSFSNQMFNKTTVTQLTDSTTTRKVETQYGDATVAVVTDYLVDLTPAQQLESVYDTGTSSVSYKTGLTYFFSDAMYIDLATTGGDIFNLNNWTLQLVITY